MSTGYETRLQASEMFSDFQTHFKNALIELFPRSVLNVDYAVNNIEFSLEDYHIWVVLELKHKTNSTRYRVRHPADVLYLHTHGIQFIAEMAVRDCINRSAHDLIPRNTYKGV